jgi:hypothetical protein
VDPENPRVAGSVDTPGSANGVAVSGTEVYVADGLGGGLRVLSTQCPDNVPVLLSNLTASQSAEGVWLHWDAALDIFLGFFVDRAETGVQSAEFLRLNGADPVTSDEPLAYLDATAEPGRSYLYKITGVLLSGEERELGTIRSSTARLPGRLLVRAVPNPAPGPVSIAYSVPRGSEVVVTLHDIAGRRVATVAQGYREAGRYWSAWDGRDRHGRALPAGQYLVRIATGGEAATQRVLLLR